MLSARPADFMSIADYLHSELSRDTKHEYIEGQIYAMAGASKNHQLIISNNVMVFGRHLKNTPCDTFTSDIKVRIGDIAFFILIFSLCVRMIAISITLKIQLLLLQYCHPLKILETKR